jgi:putative pyruvate formate lyase activating enzyme
MEKFIAAYHNLGRTTLQQRAAAAQLRLASCDLCPRRCLVDRHQGSKGTHCRSGALAIVCSHGPHHGEEAPLVGRRGSGTIFFSHCNLNCVFCQNWDISQKGEGREVTAEQLAEKMLTLQGLGCHNINLVSPSHVIAQILLALVIAEEQGLRLPLVYNSGGYDCLSSLKLLDGIIDIYMPDMKFADSRPAEKYLKAKNYADINRAAVKEMHRQVGDLQIVSGIARRGLLVRHLYLPDNLAGTPAILRFLHDEISPDTYLNLMDQYRPCYRADEYPPLDHRPGRGEFAAMLQQAKQLGLRLDRPRTSLFQ